MIVQLQNGCEYVDCLSLVIKGLTGSWDYCLPIVSKVSIWCIASPGKDQNS